jgi:hypothetical protein
MADQNQNQIKQNLQDGNQWMRIMYMFLLAIALYISLFVTGAVIVIQALFALVTGKDNVHLRELGAGLTGYITQIFSFLTFNDDRKPFPFAAWGEVETINEPASSATPSEMSDDDIIDIEVINDDTRPPK